MYVYIFFSKIVRPLVLTLRVLQGCIWLTWRRVASRGQWSKVLQGELFLCPSNNSRVLAVQDGWVSTSTTSYYLKETFYTLLTVINIAFHSFCNTYYSKNKIALFAMYKCFLGNFWYSKLTCLVNLCNLTPIHLQYILLLWIDKLSWSQLSTTRED